MTHQLDDLAFWRLRALCTDTQRLVVIAQQAREAAITAEKKQNAFLAELAKTHDIDPATLGQYTLDDETRTLTTPDARTQITA
jgi:hypothetical protein